MVVTAADDSTMQTYTLTVTRAAVVPPMGVVLVSNTGQATGASTTPNVGNIGVQTQFAQKFVTGSNPGGYILNQVILDLGSDPGAKAMPVITIRPAAGNSPHTSIIDTLTPPATVTAELVTFGTTRGVVLDSDSDYFVVIGNANTGDDSADFYGITATDVSAEDDGGLAGWDIANMGRKKSGANAWTNATGTITAFRIQLRGSERTASADATLGALTVNDGTSDLTLAPAFAPGTFDYALDVGHAVTSITIAPTVNDSNATVAYRDDNGAAIFDADPNTAGYQVALGVGETVINVVVTAEDDSTTQDYTLTVTRAAPPPLVPTGIVLVSNIGQFDNGVISVGQLSGFQVQAAQKFTTGSHPGGYTLNEVSINLSGAGANAAAGDHHKGRQQQRQQSGRRGALHPDRTGNGGCGRHHLRRTGGRDARQRHRLFCGDGEHQHHRQQRGAL